VIVADQLTQYVSVLRLMKAPSEKVMNKLLIAHKNRANRMILQFNQELSTASPSSSEFSQFAHMYNLSVHYHKCIVCCAIRCDGGFNCY
jgi:hypothetical protein